MALDWDALVIGPTIGVFGEAVTYQSIAGGAPIAITAVFDAEYLELVALASGNQGGMPSNISSARPVLGVQLSQLPVSPAQGDTLTILATGAQFAVVEVRADGHGWAKLLLNEAG